MFNFTQFLAICQIDESELKPANVVMGRFQPFHKGHSHIISKMTNPVVVIIKGAKSSEDVKRNPLTVEQQKALINKVHPNVPVIQAQSAFLPALFATLREQGYNPKKVYAGADRIQGYKSMIERNNAGAGKQLPDGKVVQRIDVEFEEMPRITSATKVREAIRDGDFDMFKMLMPEQLANKKTFEELKRAIQ